MFCTQRCQKMFSRLFFQRVQKCGIPFTYAPRVRSVARACATTGDKSFLRHIREDHADKMLHVHWRDDTQSRFPYIFLRDNCQCDECFHSSAKQRSFDTVGFADVDIEIKEANVLQDGERLSIIWPDKHESVFESYWLRKRCLPDSSSSPGRKSTIAGKGVVLWDRAMLHENIPEFDFQDVMKNEFNLLNWLKTLHSHGIALVKNAPMEQGQIRKLAERVGYLKPTHYGNTFQVASKYEANNLAYTSDSLSLHTDLPQCVDYPGIQMLHCIEQAPSNGGASIFVDGFCVSQKFKEADTQSFQLLANVPIAFCDIGVDIFGEFNMRYSRPMIELDHYGKITRFSFNNHARDSFSHVDPEETYIVYKAYIALGQMLRDPDNKIEHKMKPGDIATFNNSRVLHGRTEFQVTEEGSRFLEGMYMDWDIAYSKLRVLAERHGSLVEV